VAAGGLLAGLVIAGCGGTGNSHIHFTGNGPTSLSGQGQRGGKNSFLPSCFFAL